jgi:purine nucleoside permease
LNAGRTGDNHEIGERCIEKLPFMLALLFVTGIAGVVPFLAAHGAKAAVELALAASVDERVTAREARNDVVQGWRGMLLPIGEQGRG